LLWLRLRPNPELPPGTPDQWVQDGSTGRLPAARIAPAAEYLLGMGRGEAARALLTSRPELEGSARAQRLLGACEAGAGRYREAFARLNVSLLLDPYDPLTHWQLGELHRAEGRASEAADEDRWLAEHAAGHPAQRLLQARRAVESGRPQEALAALGEVAEPLLAGPAAALRAQALRGLGRVAEAEAVARAAWQADPAGPWALPWIRMLAESPDPARRKDATELVRRVERPGSGPEGWRELGLLCVELEAWEEAVRALRRCLELDPASVRSYPPLAAAYRGLSQPGMAAQVLGIYRVLEGVELRTAQAEYQVMAQGRTPEARVELARVYASCGLEDRARKELQQLLREVPRHPTASELLARLPERRSLRIPPLPAAPPRPAEPGAGR